MPLLPAEDITSTIMHQFEHSCRNYFIHKKVLANDQVSLIIGGLLKFHVNYWISENHDSITAPYFDVFMGEFCVSYLAKDWEEGTLHKLLSMTQANMSFWDFSTEIQFKNSLLHGTTSHLPNNKLCHQINTGMEVMLSKKYLPKRKTK